jgi:hypothetical protein
VLIPSLAPVVLRSVQFQSHLRFAEMVFGYIYWLASSFVIIVKHKPPSCTFVMATRLKSPLPVPLPLPLPLQLVGSQSQQLRWGQLGARLGGATGCGGGRVVGLGERDTTRHGRQPTHRPGIRFALVLVVVYLRACSVGWAWQASDRLGGDRRACHDTTRTCVGSTHFHRTCRRRRRLPHRSLVRLTGAMRQIWRLGQGPSADAGHARGGAARSMSKRLGYGSFFLSCCPISGCRAARTVSC